MVDTGAQWVKPLLEASKHYSSAWDGVLSLLLILAPANPRRQQQMAQVLRPFLSKCETQIVSGF